MSDLLLVCNYWPFFPLPEIRRFDYTAIDGSMEPLTAVFYFDPKRQAMIYADYDHNGTWKDNWVYTYQPGVGVNEWGDDYPNKTVVMSPGILWGDMVRVGDVISNKPKFDTFRCSPWQFGEGDQIVKFESWCAKWTNQAGKVWDDVLIFSYEQRWNCGKWTGARYYNAAGVGPIALEWIAQGPDGNFVTTARMDAVVTSYNKEALVA